MRILGIVLAVLLVAIQTRHIAVDWLGLLPYVLASCVTVAISVRKKDTIRAQFSVDQEAGAQGSRYERACAIWSALDPCLVAARSVLPDPNSPKELIPMQQA